MLIIRKEQMEVFEEAALQKFEDWMVVHLKKFFPDQCRALSDVEVREIIRYGIQKAETYDITSERDTCKYIDLMFALGQDFDTDPDLPWVQEILQDETLQDPEKRMGRLCDIAIQKQSVE